MAHRKNRFPSALTFNFVPVATTGISLSDRFEGLGKYEMSGTGSHYEEDFTSNRRVDYFEEPARQKSTSTPWSKPFKLVRPSNDGPVRQNSGDFHASRYREQKVSVHYRLSIPRERYRRNDRPFPPGFRRPYNKPRNWPFGHPYGYQHRRPVRSRVGYTNHSLGYRGRNPHFGSKSYDRRRSNRKRWVNRQKLDQEIDEYMSLTRSYLDKQLDQYVEEAKAAAAANFSAGTGSEDGQAQEAEMESLLLDMD
ncbi:unnamed protein product [Allacma fusca]|uniref:Chromatin target of PRMT1 protein C-terminal domain-containing protein n=1 Tax=Allacma fusca TaxID=39272 RepID=A0A8J2MCZ9_9HEXA|nr:unnamed protein product [Allacma fusca]